jgi:hypothetical protein
VTESSNHRVVLVPTHATPIPFEAIVALRPAAFSIDNAGYNRAPVETCMIEARDDIGAIDAWLEEFADSPRTHRAYTKEIERFYNWLVLVQGRCLPRLSRLGVARAIGSGIPRNGGPSKDRYPPAAAHRRS